LCFILDFSQAIQNIGVTSHYNYFAGKVLLTGNSLNDNNNHKDSPLLPLKNKIAFSLNASQCSEHLSYISSPTDFEGTVNMSKNFKGLLSSSGAAFTLNTKN